jgi:hypothetical protein
MFATTKSQSKFNISSAKNSESKKQHKEKDDRHERNLDSFVTFLSCTLPTYHHDSMCRFARAVQFTAFGKVREATDDESKRDSLRLRREECV